MNNPLFRPEQWILFEQHDEIDPELTVGFGKIVGGSYSDGAWQYSVHGPMADTTYALVLEESITHILESGSWMERHHAASGEQTSAYTNQN